MCQAPGATVNNPNNFGTQNVIPNCTSGCNVLSVIELTVSYKVEKYYIYIRWLCQGCLSNVTYEVSVLNKRGETRFIELTKSNDLAIPTSLLPENVGYIQIAVLNNTGHVLFKRTVYDDIIGLDKLIVYPTIVEREVNAWFGDQSVVFELYNSYGRLIRQAFGCGTWDLSDLPSGVYLITGQVKEHALNVVRILKK